MAPSGTRADAHGALPFTAAAAILPMQEHEVDQPVKATAR